MSDGDAWDEFKGDSLLMRDEIERLRREVDEIRSGVRRVYEKYLDGGAGTGWYSDVLREWGQP